jgi:hypothetical protein
MADWNGKIIDGRYAVEAVLGEGGMGVVLRARHSFTGALSAVKLLHPRLRLQDSLAARFLAEARAPATIGHPGIVRVTDAGRTPEGDLYLVMELLEGETLAARMARSPGAPLPFEAIQRILLQVLSALAAAHAAGLVHRDLKPDNVFLCAPNDAVKILDFGIAKVVREGNVEDQSATSTGSVLGTLTYMSPEQLRDAKHVDHRTDLWAVGVMLYELCTGVRPYPADTFGEMVAALLSGPPRPIGERLIQAPNGLDALVQRALVHEPSRRFGSASELAAALSAIVPSPLVRRGQKDATVVALGAAPAPAPRPLPLPAATLPELPSAGGAALPAITVPGAPIGPLARPAALTSAAAPLAMPGWQRPVPTAPMDGPRPRPPSLAAPTLVGPYAPAAPPLAPHGPPPAPPRAISSGAAVALGVGASLLVVLVLLGVGVASLAYLGNEPSAPTAQLEKEQAALCASACARSRTCGIESDPRCLVHCAASVPFRACVKEAQQSADCNTLAYCGLGAGCGGKGPSGKGSCQAAARCEAECNARQFNDTTCLCACVEAMSVEQANRLLAQNECAVLRCPTECGPSGDWGSCYACATRACAGEIQACQDH